MGGHVHRVAFKPAGAVAGSDPRPDAVPCVRLINSRWPASQVATTVTVVRRLLCSKVAVGSIFNVKEGTAPGEEREIVVPKPNWPKMLSPQQDTPPLVSRAQLWRRPVVMFTALLRGWVMTNNHDFGQSGLDFAKFVQGLADFRELTIIDHAFRVERVGGGNLKLAPSFLGSPVPGMIDNQTSHDPRGVDHESCAVRARWRHLSRLYRGMPRAGVSSRRDFRLHQRGRVPAWRAV